MQYAYVEATGNENQQFGLQSPDFYATSSWLMTFSVSTYGEDIVSLKLEYRTSSSSSWTTLWTRTLQQSVGYWEQVHESIPQDAVALRFVGETGSSFMGDMALDEISQSARYGCGLVTCTQPSIKVDHSAYINGWDESACCRISIRCNSYQCPSDLVLVANAAHVEGETEAVCCSPSCQTFDPCPQHQILRADAAVVGGNTAGDVL